MLKQFGIADLSDKVHESFVSDYVLPRRFDYFPKLLGVISGVTAKRSPLQTLQHPETHACSCRGQNTQTQTKLIGHKSRRGRKESLFSLGICDIVQNEPAEFASPHN